MSYGRSSIEGAVAPQGGFQQVVRGFVKLATFLSLIAAGPTAADARASSGHWDVVGAYDQAIGAYRSRQSEIRHADISAEEAQRRREDLGPEPDAAPAIEATIAIVKTNGERPLEAAHFLLNRVRPPEDRQESILDAVAAHIGPDWALIQEYVASEAGFLEAARSGQSGEAVRRRLEQGVEPPTWHAVSAARAMVESDHERALEAAEFLMQQTHAFEPGNMAVFLSPWWLTRSRELGEAVLAESIGPDWSVIRDYAQALQSWQSEEQAIGDGQIDERDRARRLQELGDAPKPYRALAAAQGILDAEGAHGKTREAAEFLLDNPTPGGAAKAYRGAQALAAHFPDYDQWPLRLKQVNSLSNIHPPARDFVVGLAGTLEDPLARATARYFAASYLIQSANHPNLAADERIALQERVEELAAGLSAGLEDEAFVLTKQGADGTDMPMTFADAEAELIYSLDSTMIGSVVSDVTGRRVDGTQDSLAAYAGRVVLVDFWATWCGPCKDAFPKLRQMVEEFPQDHFQIIGVSVDDELETVLDYLAGEPLQWVVWHVGSDSALVRRWRVTGFPTYVLIGPEGTILSKHPGAFNPEFRAEIEQAVRDAGQSAET